MLFSLGLAFIIALSNFITHHWFSQYQLDSLHRRSSELTSLRGWQRVNHFPGPNAITRKDTLCRTLRRMRATHGAVYDFIPATYLMPNETLKFTRDAAALNDGKGSRVKWIFKVCILPRDYDMT